MSKKKVLGRLLTSTVLTGVAATAVTPAFAQDEDDSDAGDRIVVTGSRIVREDLASPSPVARVDSEQLVLTNTVNTEQFLDTLPQVVPSFDQTSNNPGTGQATVSLRGLGTGRTLVLVDGSRFVQSFSSGVTAVDLNNIPSALVDRIEIVTGGASAVYGSDAVAGVVNFILKDDFEGIQLDVSDQMSVAGWDANQFNVALTLGGNFADGRGNAIMSLSYTNRRPLLQGEREFSSLSLFDPGPGGTQFVSGGSGNALGGQWFEVIGNGWDTDSMTAGVQPLAGCTDPPNCSLTFNGAPDGRLFVNPDDQYNYAPTNYLQLPQERYSIYAGASYEITDHIEAYARGIFASTFVDQQLAPTPVGGTVAVSLDNPFITPAFADTLAATYAGNLVDQDGDGEVDDALVFVARRYNDDTVGNRNSNSDTSAFQIKMGVRGDLSDNWNYDLYFQFGRSFNNQIQSGNISFSSLFDGVLDGTCNIFGVNTINQACADAITRTGSIATQLEQTQIVGVVDGTIDALRMPGAEDAVGVAFGVEYREEFMDSLPDSVLGPDVRGFNAALPIKGRYDVYEAFMEANVPIIQDVPLIEEFTINGAYRYSEYSTGAGTTHTFAAGGDWVPVEDLRFRAQFQRAVRAPNIAELFAPATNGFPGASDPCSGGGFGTFDDFDPATQATVMANCLTFGVPVPGANFQNSGQIEALFGGNPNVEAEVSDTLTIGVVWQPSMVDGLTLQVDFYDIDISGAIAGLPLQLLLDRCYVEGDLATCNQFFGPGTRNPANGRIGSPFLPTLGVGNIASLGARGIDFQANYGFDWADLGVGGDAGSMSFVYYGNYTLQSNFLPDPTATLVECTGEFGVNCGEPTPTYKHTMQASWLWGPLTTSVRWRLIGGVVLSPEEVIALQIGDLSDSIPMTNYVDVTLQYALGEHIDLTVGVQNITGKDAPLLGSTVNEQANTFPATYETLGRQLFFGASFKF